MLIGVILIIKVNWKRKTCSLHRHSFKYSEFDTNDHLVHILFFFKKKNYSCSGPPYMIKLAFYEQQSFALLLCQRKRLFSSFVTPDFKKRQKRNETSSKSGTKFTGIFASLVIKSLTPLVLKVQTRATLEQKMMPIKN